jgi:hypothetical protein
VVLVKEEGKKGICSTAYLNQVLEAVVFPFYDSLTLEQKAEFIFMEDRAKVHKGKARLPRLNRGICGFD